MPPPPPSLEYPVAEEDAALAGLATAMAPELAAAETAEEVLVAESTVPALEPVAPAEAGESPVERVVAEAGEPPVEPASTEMSETSPELEANAPEAPTLATPEDAATGTPPSVKEAAAVPVASESEAETTTTAVAVEAAASIPLPEEPAELAAKAIELTAPTPSSESAAEDKPAA